MHQRRRNGALGDKVVAPICRMEHSAASIVHSLVFELALAALIPDEPAWVKERVAKEEYRELLRSKHVIMLQRKEREEKLQPLHLTMCEHRES